MKKKKKGKVRWLAVLLAGCLLLSIVPATAFAAEDTAPAKSENSAGEEIQMPEQQNEQPKPDYLPQGVTYFSDGYKHAYHTRVDVTANVSVKDSTGTVVETTQVSKSSGEFNFIAEEFPSA